MSRAQLEEVNRLLPEHDSLVRKLRTKDTLRRRRRLTEIVTMLGKLGVYL